MIGQAADLADDLSVAATVPTAAIAAVTGINTTGMPPAVVLTRPVLPFAPRPTTNTKQSGDRGTHQEDPNNPHEKLAQILAPSTVDTLKGNQR
jgi:hypothetical protein